MEEGTGCQALHTGNPSLILGDDVKKVFSLWLKYKRRFKDESSMSICAENCYGLLLRIWQEKEGAVGARRLSWREFLKFVEANSTALRVRASNLEKHGKKFVKKCWTCFADFIKEVN
jgi:hypothetical protein